MRDAAAYVCWAFGRAYYHTDMRSVLEALAPHLLIVACYDREVAKGFCSMFPLFLLLMFSQELYVFMLLQQWSFGFTIRLTVEGQQLQHFRRTLVDKGTFHMALILWIRLITLHLLHEQTLIFMLLSPLLNMMATFILLWMNCLTARSATGYVNCSIEVIFCSLWYLDFMF